MNFALGALLTRNGSVKLRDEVPEEDIADDGAIVSAAPRIDDDRHDEEAATSVLQAAYLPVLSLEIVNSASIKASGFTQVKLADWRSQLGTKK